MLKPINNIKMMLQIVFTYYVKDNTPGAVVQDSIKLQTTLDKSIDLASYINDFLRVGQTLKSIDSVTEIKDFMNNSNETAVEDELLDVLITAQVTNYDNEKYLKSWVVQIASLNNAVVQHVIEDMIGPNNDIWRLSYIHDIKIIK